MALSINLVSQSLNIVTESLLPSLTSLQKKILAIALTALACLSASLYYFMKMKADSQKIEKKVKPLDQKNEEVKETEKQTKAPQSPSSDKLKEDKKNDESVLQDDVKTQKNVNSLAKSLLFPTIEPVQHSASEFGGDDTNNPTSTPQLIAENEQARLMIIEALGGVEACKKIPIVECPRLSSYLDCFSQYEAFPIGHAIVQGEDQAGRKFVLIRLQDKNDKTIVVQRIFQRRRETCMIPTHRDQDGACWISKRWGKGDIWGADDNAQMIKEILSGTSDYYTLAPQQ